jgi:hypothetical protein
VPLFIKSYIHCAVYLLRVVSPQLSLLILLLISAYPGQLCRFSHDEGVIKGELSNTRTKSSSASGVPSNLQQQQRNEKKLLACYNWKNTG